MNKSDPVLSSAVKRKVDKIPGWVSRLSASLVATAEVTITTGKARKKWAKAVLREALRAHDIKWLPDGLESAAEDHICDIVIERTWKMIFGSKRRKTNKLGIVK